MVEERYYVTYNNQTVAENCDMETALMIVKAYFEKYYLETDMVMAISRWDKNDNTKA